MTTLPPRDPTEAPHLSLAARRLLARSREQGAPVNATPAIVRPPRWRRWLPATLFTFLLVAGIVAMGTWFFPNGRVVAPDFTFLEQWTGSTVATPTPQPSDEEFAALLHEELQAESEEASSQRALIGAPPQAEAPSPNAPSLPAITPTPIVDAKVRPLPWPAIPAEGRPDRIYAPHVGLDAEIVPVGFSIRETNGYLVRIYEVARWAAGWHTNSSLPGWQGNTILAGHHNAWGSVFRPALNLEPGDFLFVDVDDVTYSYLVVIKETLPETNFEERRANGRWIAQTEDERLTLVTCWPPDGNTHRVVIVAIPAK